MLELVHHPGQSVMKPVNDVTIISGTATTDNLKEPHALEITSGPDSELIDYSLRQPVQVVEETIRVKERLMEADHPYAFNYKGKDYLLSKKQGMIQLFELKD